MDFLSMNFDTNAQARERSRARLISEINCADPVSYLNKVFVTIDSDVWIGPGATLSNGITVGAGSSIGMGSNQFESLPSGRKVIGRPSIKGY